MGNPESTAQRAAEISPLFCISPHRITVRCTGRYAFGSCLLFISNEARYFVVLPRMS